MDIELFLEELSLVHICASGTLLSLLFLVPLGFAGTAHAAALFNQNLAYGASGQEVIDLQNFLTTQCVYAGPITGNFFSLTKAALITFQTHNDIQPASGFFGPLTRALANSLIAKNAATSSQSVALQPKVAQAQTTSTTTLPAPTPHRNARGRLSLLHPANDVAVHLCILEWLQH